MKENDGHSNLIYIYIIISYIFSDKLKEKENPVVQNRNQGIRHHHPPILIDKESSDDAKSNRRLVSFLDGQIFFDRTKSLLHINFMLSDVLAVYASPHQVILNP